MINLERLKTNNRFIYYRIYCVAVFLVWNVVFLWIFTHHKQNIRYAFLMVPFMLPAMVMICNLAIFPFKYSIFGPNERTPFPKEQPIFEKYNFWGGIGWFSGSGRVFSFRMHIFTSGVGISFFGGAKAFISKSNISFIESSFNGYKLIHNSAELHNPIIFSSKDNFEKIQTILKLKGHNT